MQLTSSYYEAGEVQAYAIRRINPFLGVLQVIETEAGRAISSNGIVWDIELRSERPAGWGSLNTTTKDIAYYRFGLWSKDEGMVSRPLAPHLDKDPLMIQCETLIECIEQRLAYLPFKLIDNRELWLFDKTQRQPIVLLATLAPEGKPPSPEPKYWKSRLGAEGVPSQYRYPDAVALEKLVEDTASLNISAFWISREDDGSGILEHSGKTIERDEIPPYLISENWSDPEQNLLVNNYIKWIAPSLLTLQNLSISQREHLENCLNIQAISVEHHWHLYPETLDEKKLKAARVQCRLQKIL